MKKSDIYKHALAATVREMGISGDTPDEIYDVVSELCNLIKYELLTENYEDKHDDMKGAECSE